MSAASQLVDPWPRRPAWTRLERVAGMRVADAACLYAALGLHPIALHGIDAAGNCTCGRLGCPSAGKHPVERGWQAGPLRYDELSDCLFDHPLANIGLRMGSQPGGFRLVCIDVDGDRSLLEPLEAEHGRLPPTLTASSGKGLHYIYRLEPGAPMPKNRVRMGPGVDVRSAGGQIVAAPSKHVSGRIYRWAEVRAPEVLP